MSAGLGGLLLILVGWFFVNRSVNWLQAQANYQLAFREIALDPDPPAWYVGGRIAFLDQVPRGELNPGPFSTLNLDLATLETLIKRNPVVKRVTRVEVHHPRQVVVHLDYREPIAVLWLKGKPDVVIDAEGVLLPVEGIALSMLKSLVSLGGFAPPVAPRMGEAWNRVTSTGPLPEPEPDPHVFEAARLAAFLKSKIESESQSDGAIERKLGHITLHQNPDHILFVEFGRRLIQWTGYTSESSTDEARWTMVCAWLREQPSSEGDSRVRFWFGPRGIEPVPIVPSTPRSSQPVSIIR